MQKIEYVHTYLIAFYFNLRKVELRIVILFPQNFSKCAYVHRFYIDEMVETWSAKVCAENHNARDTFFALTFLITCVQFQMRQHTMGYFVLKLCQSIFQLESEYKKSSKLAKNYENSGTHF